MPSYLLVEFDDHRDAEVEARKIEAKAEPGLRVAGMYKGPNTACECPVTEQYHRSQIAKGKKFGWWVHTLCRRARRGTHQLRNLIAPGARTYRRDEGFVLVVGNLEVFDVLAQNIKRVEN